MLGLNSPPTNGIVEKSARSPLVPALIHDGVIHIESTDILNYLDKTFPTPCLQPTNDADNKNMFNWMGLAADNHIHVKAYMFAHQIGASGIIGPTGKRATSTPTFKSIKEILPPVLLATIKVPSNPGR